MTTDQLMMAATAPVASAAFGQGPKSILLHVQDDSSLEERLETALSLARSCAAHLSCIHVTPMQAYVAFDNFGGMFVMKKAMEAIDEQAAKLRERLEAKLSIEDVSWDFEEINGDVAAAIINRAALSDIVVAGRHPRHQDFVGPSVGLLGDLLYHCRSPILVPGDDQPVLDPTTTAVIAWDGSYEAANTIRASIDLLKIAQEVKIIQVAEEKPTPFPGTRMLEYLSRHGIHAELTVLQPPGGYADHKAIAASLVSQVPQGGYLVLGGYSHSRAGEYVFGGVTRSLFNQCPITLVIGR